MDWKILIVVLAVLLGFFTYRQCSEKEQNYDQIQEKERTERLAEYSQEKTKSESNKKSNLQAEARAKRGQRPEPKTYILETEEFSAVFSTRSASLMSLTMKNHQYKEAPRDWTTGLRKEGKEHIAPVDLVTTNSPEYEMFSPLRFEINESTGLEALLPDADYEIWDKSKDHVVFRYVQPDAPVEIYKKFEVTDKSMPYLLWMTVRVVNTGNTKISFRSSVSQHGYQHKSESEGSIFGKPPNQLQGICRFGTEIKSIPWNKDDLNQPFTATGTIGFVGVHTNFFIGAMMPGDDTPSTCYFASNLDNPAHYPTHKLQPWGHVIAELRFAEISLAPGESKTFKIKNYLGPKQYQVLQRVGGGLQKSVDFGVLWPICRLLLKLLFIFQSFVVNWGLAIIILTAVVKIVLMPLTQKTFQSQAKMKALKPELDKLNEKFKTDPQAKQQAIMALYKQHKINPLGGCLPILLQMPIWFALYSTLRTSPELYRAPFFGWITDLSSPDPYFVTPLLMGALMFLQNKMTPAMGDQLQAKIMTYFMPIMFTAMMLFLPSGLTIYILVNSVLSIAQQFYQNRKTKPAQA